MSIDDLLHRVFAGRTQASPVEPTAYLLRQLISDESNAWNLAALAVAQQEWAPKDSVIAMQRQPRPAPAPRSVQGPGALSAQEQTLRWNERALERLSREDKP